MSTAERRNRELTAVAEQAFYEELMGADLVVDKEGFIAQTAGGGSMTAAGEDSVSDSPDLNFGKGRREVSMGILCNDGFFRTFPCTVTREQYYGDAR